MENRNKRKYFLIQLKKEIPFTIFNLVVFSLLYILPLAFSNQYNIIEYSDSGIRSYYHYFNLSTNYGFIVGALAIYAVIVPVKALFFLTKKKYIDSYYSLPIERKDITFIQIIVNILCVLMPFTIVFFSGSLVTLIFYHKIIYIYYVILYLILIVCFILYFMYNAFFFSRANKVLDGIVTVIFANFIFLLLMASIVEGLNLSKYKVIEVLNIKGSELNYLSLPFMPFIRYGNYFNEMIVSKYDYHDYVLRMNNQTIIKEEILNYDSWFAEHRTPFNPIYLIFLGILGIVAIILFIVLFNKRKPEQSEEIGTSCFGLKVLSPICFSLLTILLSIETKLVISWVSFIIVIIGYLGITLLELRTFKFPLYKILMLVGMFTLTFVSLFYYYL